MGSLKKTVDPSAAFSVSGAIRSNPRTGLEPLLGGELREKAVWVDESACIGCRYCAHVATNTFVIEPFLGRSRVIRQDGDHTDRIQEAIDTCPVDCIHWVPFEELADLKERLLQMNIQPLGLPPKPSRRIKPRAN